MEINRRTAIAFGVLLIAAIVCGVLNSVPAIEAPDYLENLDSIESRILVAGSFQAAMATIYVAIAVIMYPIVKMDSRNGALAYFALNVPSALLEITLAVYLITRGFRRTSPSLTPSPSN